MLQPERCISLPLQSGRSRKLSYLLQECSCHRLCSLNAEKIERSRAVITRRLMPGQWTYSIDILEQDSLLKQLKKQFHQNHEPSGGRELTWMMKLLLNLA